jgi:hypothetical protein
VLPCAAPEDHRCVSLATQTPVGNTLNRRSDSIQFKVSCAATSHVVNFLRARRRDSMPQGLFELPFAACPVRACGRGNFFAQKIQLAGHEQTDRCDDGIVGAWQRPWHTRIQGLLRHAFARRDWELAHCEKKWARAKRAH